MFDSRHVPLIPPFLEEDMAYPLKEEIIGEKGEYRQHRQNDIEPCMKGNTSAQTAKPFLDLFPNLLKYTLLFHRLRVLMSLFSTISNPSMLKPFGLSSLRFVFSRRHSVTRLRSVTLLARIISCRAYVLAEYG